MKISDIRNIQVEDVFFEPKHRMVVREVGKRQLVKIEGTAEIEVIIFTAGDIFDHRLFNAADL